MAIKRKAINFDLDTKAIKKYHPKGNRRAAYRDIKLFLTQNGFSHRQFSGYRSLKPMPDVQINDLVAQMKETFPWLHYCVKIFDVTDVGRNHDYANFFRSDDTHIAFEKKSNAKEPVKTAESHSPRNPPLETIISSANAKRKPNKNELNRGQTYAFSEKEK